MKTIRIFILGLLMVMLSLPNTSFAVFWNDGSVIHEYQIFQSSGISWDNAASWINANLGSNWHLATITSPAEQSFIDINVFGNLSREYWIGGYQNPIDPPPSANWHWVTGEPWVYTNWTPGEPNDYYGPGSESYLGANWNGSYWNDEGALGNIAGFVAERNPVQVPEPASILLMSLGLIGLARYGRKKFFKK
jgi:hypothetical protein